MGKAVHGMQEQAEQCVSTDVGGCKRWEKKFFVNYNSIKYTAISDDILYLYFFICKFFHAC